MCQVGSIPKVELNIKLTSTRILDKILAFH
jgi:hypothetical protein